MASCYLSQSDCRSVCIKCFAFVDLQLHESTGTGGYPCSIVSLGLLDWWLSSTRALYVAAVGKAWSLLGVPRRLGPCSIILLLSKTFAPLEVHLYFQVTSDVFETGKKLHCGSVLFR